MGEINQMRLLGMIVRLEYTGSTCEQANVANSPDNYYLEHDVMIIMNGRKTDLQLLEHDHHIMLEIVVVWTVDHVGNDSNESRLCAVKVP